MPTYNTTSEVIDILFRRIEMLGSLLEGSKTEHTLANKLDGSRSTVNRAIRECESLELVEQNEVGIGLPLCGRLAVKEVEG